MNIAAFAAALVAGLGLCARSLAGQSQKWERVPEAVRATILANGGKVGAVDKESEKIDGKGVYEAVGKDKSGKEVDLVITEDGKLVMFKDDDAADRAAEQAAKTRTELAKLKFSHPREITNPWLPLALVKQDILEGREEGKLVRIERTAKPEVHKAFKVGKQSVEALAFEDREFEDGKLAEVALDYFAQADDGTVYYLGEDVDEYKDGKVVGHGGAWLLGVQTQVPGVLFLAHPRVGGKFFSENVPNITTEEDEVVSLSETVTVPAGTYQNCVKVKEKLSDGKTEFKYYAPGVGVVKEVPAEGEVLLTTHTVR
jgi:hypothetical protein